MLTVSSRTSVISIQLKFSNEIGKNVWLLIINVQMVFHEQKKMKGITPGVTGNEISDAKCPTGKDTIRLVVITACSETIRTVFYYRKIVWNYVFVH